MGDTDKVQVFHDDAVEHGLEILPPDINTSGYRFRPVDVRSIRYGLGGIKGTGEAAINDSRPYAVAFFPDFRVLLNVCTGRQEEKDSLP